MAGGRKIIIWAIGGVLLLVVAAAGYFFFIILNQKPKPLMQAVPGETAVLIRPLNLKDLPGAPEVKKDQLAILSSLPSLQERPGGTIFLDSLLNLDETIMAMIRQNEAFLALVPVPDSAAEVLVLFELKDILEERALKKFITGHFTVIKQETENKNWKISRIETEVPYYYSIEDGIFAGSASLDAVKLALAQTALDSEAFTRSEFREVMDAAGKNVDANIYFNTRQVIDLVMCGKVENSFDIARLPGDFASLDLVMKDNGLLMNGFFTSRAGSTGLANLFDDQEVGSGCPSVLPSGTTEFFKLAFSNFDSLCFSLARLKFQAGFGDKVPAVSEFEKRHFTGWTDREVTIAAAGHGKQLAVFSIIQNADALTELAGITTGKPVEFMDAQIFRISREGMVRDLLWPFSGDVAMPYYCLLDGQIVFGSSEEFLRQVVRNFASGKTLSNTRHYQSVAPHITETSHLSYYIDLEKSYRDTEITDQAGSDKEPLQHFPAFTAQFSLSGKWLYASMFAAFQDSITDTGLYIWKAVLDGTPSAGPFLAAARQPERSRVFIADSQNKLYILSMDGEIQARRQLAGQPLGGVVELPHSGDPFRFLLNTSGQLYLIDSAGNDAPGFPYRLDPEASAGLFLLPGADEENTLVLVPSADQAVYAYTLKPGPAVGWQTPSLKATPSGSPLYFKEKQKEYLIFRDSEEGILVTDRKGKEKRRFQFSAAARGHSPLYLNRTNSRGTFITTDSRGHLIYLPDNGKVQETVFDDFSPEHYFLYSDFDGKGGEDFIFFDLGMLRIFDRFKKELIKVPLPELPSSLPVVFSTRGKGKGLLYQGTSGTIYLVDNQGNIFYDEEIMSSLPPVVLKDASLEAFYALITRGNSVCLSPLP